MFINKNLIFHQSFPFISNFSLSINLLFLHPGTTIRQVMAIKSRAVLPYLVPQLTASPVNTKEFTKTGLNIVVLKEYTIHRYEKSL